MNRDEIDRFLKETRIATLVTLQDDGSPNALPLWYEWDGVHLWMFSSRNTGKVRRLSKDNRACVSVHDPVGAPEAWVSVEGTVELLDEGGKELACRLTSSYYEPEQAQKTVDVWSKKDDWVLLKLTPTRIRSY